MPQVVAAGDAARAQTRVAFSPILDVPKTHQARRQHQGVRGAAAPLTGKCEKSPVKLSLTHFRCFLSQYRETVPV